MTTEDTPPYYCRRIKSNVMAEPIDDVTGRIVVGCQHYTGTNKYPCIKDSPRFKKCLVKLAVQRETKEKGRVSFY